MKKTFFPWVSYFWRFCLLFWLSLFISLFYSPFNSSHVLIDIFFIYWEEKRQKCVVLNTVIVLFKLCSILDQKRIHIYDEYRKDDFEGLANLTNKNMFKKHLDNQLSCKLQPRQDHRCNVRLLEHKVNQWKLGSSIELLARMTWNTRSTLPMAASFQQQLG